MEENTVNLAPPYISICSSFRHYLQSKKTFFADPLFTAQLVLPKIFEWYEADFRQYIAKQFGKKYPAENTEWVWDLPFAWYVSLAPG